MWLGPTNSSPEPLTAPGPKDRHTSHRGNTKYTYFSLYKQMNLRLAELVAQQPCQKPQATPLPMSREGAWLAAVPSPHPLAGTWLLLFFSFIMCQESLLLPRPHSLAPGDQDTAVHERRKQQSSLPRQWSDSNTASSPRQRKPCSLSHSEL